MTAVIQWALIAVFGLMTLAALWPTINGAWHRQWKFAGAALLFAVLFFFTTLGCTEGACVLTDPNAPRLR